MARVLALVSFKIFPPHMGGQKGVALFYEYLSRYHQVLMLASKDNTEEIEAGYPVETLLYPNKKMFSNWKQLSRIRKIIKKEKIDCIITEHSYTGWMAWLLRKKTGCPFIIHSHNIEAQRFRQMKKKGWQVYHPYEKWIHAQADFNFFISREDREKALEDFLLDPSKCAVVPYGIEEPVKKPGARERLRQQFGIKSEFIFHFNGTMDYEPNVYAVTDLAEKLVPLLEKKGLDFTILITGKRLDAAIQEKIRKTGRIIYADFVPDIDEVYQGSDLFLNAVVNNSGVKTKVIEALANDCTVISSSSGAAGIDPESYGEKMQIRPDNDWVAFADAVAARAGKNISTPETFFSSYSWERIAADAAAIIDNIVKHEPGT